MDDQANDELAHTRQAQQNLVDSYTNAAYALHNFISKLGDRPKNRQALIQFLAQYGDAPQPTVHALFNAAKDVEKKRRALQEAFGALEQSIDEPQ